MNEIRCKHCNRLLGKGAALELTIKCPRCKTYNTILRTDCPNKEPRDVPTQDKECGYISRNL